MRILVNALPARDGGGLRYLIEEMRGIEAVAPDTSLELLASPWGYKPIAESVRSQVRSVDVKSVGDRFVFEQTVLRKRARKWDVLYCPLNFGPVLFGGSRSVVTVHNSNYFGHGLSMAGTRRARPWIKVHACHASLRASRQIVAISDSLRNEIVRTLPDVAPKIRVIKSGRPDWASVRSNPVELPQRRFLLTVGSAGPHKRLEEVVKGWSAAVCNTGDEVGLVIVGDLTKGRRRHHQFLAGRAVGLLTHLGAVKDRGELRWLYERATAVVSMSSLEAFPLTVTEAGQLGCPLVLSDIPAHREVSLGNATFVPVGSTKDLERALLRAFSGSPRSHLWTWPVTWEERATELVSLFAEVAGGTPLRNSATVR